MKKLLAMVLALVMTLSLAVSANAAFKDDKSISDDYAESVAVLNGMGVFKGYEDGSFKPSGKVTGYEVLAMILRAVGYDKNNEFSGADWALHVAQTAQQLGVLDNVAKTTDLNAPASRELVAELLFQGIQKAQVTYTPAFGYVTDKVIGTKTNSLGEKNFKLASAAASDKWGRPATKWTYTTGDKATTFVEKPDLTYTKAVAECDVAHDLDLSADTAYALIVNGQPQTTTYTVNLTDTVTKMGAQGRLFEVYDMGSAGYRFVEINTYLAKVTKVTAASTDRNGHVTDATVDRKVYQVNDTGIDEAGVEAEGFTVGQYVLVTMTVDTTVSLADNLISPLPPALNTTNSAATLVMSTCERSNSIAALAAVVTSGPASLTRQLASRAAATSCCTAVTDDVSALVFSVSSWLLSAVSSLCVRSLKSDIWMKSDFSQSGRA